MPYGSNGCSKNKKGKVIKLCEMPRSILEPPQLWYKKKLRTQNPDVRTGTPASTKMEGRWLEDLHSSDPEHLTLCTGCWWQIWDHPKKHVHKTMPVHILILICILKNSLFSGSLVKGSDFFFKSVSSCLHKIKGEQVCLKTYQIISLYRASIFLVPLICFLIASYTSLP